MYSRGQSGGGGAPTGSGPTGGMPSGPNNASAKPSSDYGNYGTGYGM